MLSRMKIRFSRDARQSSNNADTLLSSIAIKSVNIRTRIVHFCFRTVELTFSRVRLAVC